MINVRIRSILIAACLALATSTQLVFADTFDAVSTSVEAPLSTGSPRIVLKNGNSLLVLDKSGMIDARAGSPYGLYQDDTRYLSRWEIRVDGKQPGLLTSFTQDGYSGSFLYGIGDNVMIQRDIVILDGINERISVRNYSLKPVKFKLEIANDGDFKDMFEVRGIPRKKHAPPPSAFAAPSWEKDIPIALETYRGLDGKTRMLYISSSTKPSLWNFHNLVYDVAVDPGASQSIDLRVSTSNSPEKYRSKLAFPDAKQLADKNYAEWQEKIPHFSTDWDLLNYMLAQSWRDLYVLQQDTPKGPCIAAGLPWYSTAFGRDQCITALQTLEFVPQLSRDVLNVLAANQGKTHDSFTEEEPGRIMHELRLGEMAGCKEIAFIPYYGTVDATPLWLMLLSRYVDATGDMEFAKSLWGNAEAAISYIEKSTASDGFLYYGGKAGAALSNQGWKDSGDSIMHKDGQLATAPIALCEVQGYLYDAYAGTAKLASRLGHDSVAKRLNDRAAKLKEQFKKAFWLAPNRLVALALDGTGKPCDVVSSNPGHLLNTGLLDDEMAEAVSSRVMKDDMFSGWGIRTLSSGELRYNPLSYHDGSIWPHDNAMIVEGMSRRGKMKEASTVMESLILSARKWGDDRLPELFCGFPKSEYRTPVPYAVSCVPQAWAAGAVVQMLKSILGIELVDNKIRIAHPKLPDSLNLVRVTGLHSNGKTVDVNFRRDQNSGEVVVSSSSTDVIVEK